jgi:hypothetical protein
MHCSKCIITTVTHVQTLTTINLSENQLGAGGVRYLATALSLNQVRLACAQLNALQYQYRS